MHYFYVLRSSPYLIILLAGLLLSCTASPNSSASVFTLVLEPMTAEGSVSLAAKDRPVEALSETKNTETNTKTLSYNLVPGLYEVEVTAEGYLTNSQQVSINANSENSLRIKLEANTPPVAIIKTSALTGQVPLNISFDASESHDPDGELTSYAWDFGDGSKQTTERTEHTFTEADSYKVTLIVTDENGASSSTAVNIDAYDLFQASPKRGDAPLEVKFEVKQNSDLLPEEGYQWTFGDGGSATGSEPIHTYKTPGLYTAELVINQSPPITKRIDIEVTNSAPTASFTRTPQEAETQMDIQFDASASSDPNDSIILYEWDFGDGTRATGPSVTHRYTRSGDFEVSLRTQDQFGAQTTSKKTLKILSQAPRAIFTLSADTGREPLIIDLDASGSSDPDGQILSYQWDFGDGATLEGKQVSHTYTRGGNFTINLTVTDDTGREASVSRLIAVTETFELAELKLSSDKRKFTKNNEPFFWLGDTAWLLFSSTKQEDALLYLDNAVAKGFNVVQVFLTAAWSRNGDNGENDFGEAPFIDNDPTRLNPAYFDYAEWVIDEAAKRGLYIALAFGEPGRHTDKRVIYSLSSKEQAYNYGHAVGTRLSKHTLANNIIWLNGQDSVLREGFSIDNWRAMNEGLADGVNGIKLLDDQADYSSLLMSYHPAGCCSSSRWFHEDEWLDFNAINTHVNYWNIVPLIQEDYSYTPIKPTVCSEHAYENNTKRDELKTDWHVRFQAYWCYLSGAAGHAYGYQFGYRMTAFTDWPNHLESPGRIDMGHFKALIDSRPFLDLVPDQSLISSDKGLADANKTYIAAARSRKGSYALVYSTQGLGFTLDLTNLSGQVNAQWFNPRNGSYQAIGSFANTSNQSFDPPGTPGPGNDWLLVLDSM